MRYMDAHNETEFVLAALAHWESVDLYIGGSEHATGHLLYSRFGTNSQRIKVLRQLKSHSKN
jgi:leucyl-tRNA synthetase